MNYRQVYTIKSKLEKKIKEICPEISHRSGIYIFSRSDESGLKFCYVGQAKHLLERTAAHLKEYDHIGLSLKKRGLYSTDNPYGWKLTFKECGFEALDENEQKTIVYMANKGYQLYNVTTGGQGKGKTSIDGKSKSPKTYRDGVQFGRESARRDIANLFEKHLNYSPKKDPPTKLQEKAVEKFKKFLEKP